MKSKIAYVFFCAVLSCISRSTGYLRVVFAIYFTQLHTADHISIDTQKEEWKYKLKHVSQPATREFSVHILNIYSGVLWTNLFCGLSGIAF